MSNKSRHTKQDIIVLEGYEHVRLRPKMYLGEINHSGFMTTLKAILHEFLAMAKVHHLLFEFEKKSSLRLSFINIENQIPAHLGKSKIQYEIPHMLYFTVLNALSETFTIKFWDKNAKLIRQQKFEYGKLKEGQIEYKLLDCKMLEIECLLDKSIWGENFEWNTNYINQQLMDFAYLYKRTKFEIKYNVYGEACKSIYHFKSGLKNQLNIAILNRLGGSYLETYFESELDNFEIEVAFAFKNYTSEKMSIKSYVNDHHTPENGTHVDGLLRGLKVGIRKYLKQNGLMKTHKISTKILKENIIATLNIRIDKAAYAGSVKNRLVNKEVAEPISNHIAQLFFKKLKEDEEASERLISHFEVCF